MSETTNGHHDKSVKAATAGGEPRSRDSAIWPGLVAKIGTNNQNIQPTTRQKLCEVYKIKLQKAKKDQDR